MSKSPKLSIMKKTLIVVGIIVLLTLIITSLNVFRKIYSPNVVLSSKATDYVYIRTGSNLEDICNNLYENNFIVNRSSFEWLAEKKNLAIHIKPGRYKIQSGMSNNELVDLLRSGKQDPVRFSINNIRTISELAGHTSRCLEVDSAGLFQLLNDNEYLKQFGFNSYTAMAMFIPNTYKIFWNTNADEFIKRMYVEQQKFWNEHRIELSKSIGLTPTQVITLASIVDDETNISSEYAIIAGVYMNRLKHKIPLQADPTVKFALGDFGIKRVLKKHTEIDSPYNTYKNLGLPPGPISMPSVKSIDAILNYEKHNYLYFCAKADFSGYHTFAKTLSQHNQNANAYQKELNKRKIYN